MVLPPVPANYLTGLCISSLIFQEGIHLPSQNYSVESIGFGIQWNVRCGKVFLYLKVGSGSNLGNGLVGMVLGKIVK